ncbi:hypothetical protein [Mesorhizobium sp. M4B.F.Ca.ET.058.02.1.1]|uniref:hypothetical protein n=1 Tax=Mesorhizobium sp. M4B.F.Ca.ET.058.02.1.1 TaxID=2493675 RepID=UPI00167EA4C2|nr:hypothetical protein [Mesorhizobium sp. M4B.F.Ca.ET.058.02.1.1]
MVAVLAFAARRIANAAAFAVIGDVRLEVIAIPGVVVLQPATTEAAAMASKAFLERIGMDVLLVDRVCYAALGRVPPRIGSNESENFCEAFRHAPANKAPLPLVSEWRVWRGTALPSTTRLRL